MNLLPRRGIRAIDINLVIICIIMGFKALRLGKVAWCKTDLKRFTLGTPDLSGLNKKWGIRKWRQQLLTFCFKRGREMGIVAKGNMKLIYS